MRIRSGQAGATFDFNRTRLLGERKMVICKQRDFGKALRSKLKRLGHSSLIFTIAAVLTAQSLPVRAEVSDAEFAKVANEVAELKAQIKTLKSNVAQARSDAHKARVISAKRRNFVSAPATASAAPYNIPVADTTDKQSFLGRWLPNAKDPLPDHLSYMGVTFWGDVDVGFAAQTAGNPLSGLYWGLNYQPILSAPAALNRPIYSLAPNALSQSGIGIKVNENLWYGFAAVGAFDTGFDPLTGELDDACKTLIANNGRAIAQQSVYSDGSRCGQILNGNAYGGISHPVYGKLTFGRQATLATTMFDYDPMEGSFALSMIGWVTSMAGGQGVSGAGRWDNSVKYTNQYGPIHGGVMYAEGGDGSALHGYGIAGDLGATWKGFSIDGIYSVQTDGLVNSIFGAGACGGIGQPSCNTLKSTAVNTRGLVILGKYVYEFGPHNRLTFYGGFDQVKYTNPTNPQYAGESTGGGYIIGAVNNTAYAFGDKLRQIFWGGAKYETGPWAFALAYYRMNQPYYATSATSKPCSNTSASNCAGTSNTVSGLIDYTIDKHFDVYTGVVWNNYDGGFANGANVTSATTSITGVRLRF
ncbi:MAG: porin [Pseudomonadota bacterium]